MDIEEYSDKAKRLGARLLEERERSEISIARAAVQLGVSPEMIESMERGEIAASLPELELLANLYRVPLHELLGLVKMAPPVRLAQEKRPAFIVIRTRIIGAILKQARLDNGLSLEDSAENLGVPPNTLDEYESGNLPVPQPVLEKACNMLGIEMDSLLSPLTPKSKPVDAQSGSPALPAELADFVANSTNQPYLTLAKKLSEMDAAKLRTIAESLLEITY